MTTSTRYHDFNFPERRFPEVGGTFEDGEPAFMVTPYYIERGPRRDVERQNLIMFAYCEHIANGSPHKTYGYARPGQIVSTSLLFGLEPEVDRGRLMADLIAARRIVEIGTIRIIGGYIRVALTAPGARVVYQFDDFCRSQLVEYYGHEVENPRGVEIIQPRRKSDQFPNGPTVSAKDRRGSWETYGWPRLLRRDHVGEDRLPAPENAPVVGRLYPDDRLELTPAARAELARLCVEAYEGVSAPYFAETIAQLAEPEPRAPEPQVDETPPEAPAEAAVPKARKRGAE